nr:FtsK/SpoIIIE domain-containing protein [Brevibacterium daeguense]
MLTAVGPDAVPHDLTIECEETTTVGDLALRAAEHLGILRASTPSLTAAGNGGSPVSALSADRGWSAESGGNGRSAESAESAGNGSPAPWHVGAPPPAQLASVPELREVPELSEVPEASHRPEKRTGAPRPALPQAQAAAPILQAPILPAPPSTAPEVPLYLAGTMLDGSQLVAESPLRHGVIVGVGQPVPGITSEPTGALEVRITSGRGAGKTYRLSVGSWTVGSDPLCAIPLDDHLVPGQALSLEVTDDGAVWIVPTPEIVGATRPVPPRRRPLEGPILIPVPPTKLYEAGRKGRKEMKRDRQIGLDSNHTEVDPNDPIPLIHLDRIPVHFNSVWHPGTSLSVGNTLLELAWVTPPDASLSDTPAGATKDFNRPPRLLPAARPKRFTYPGEPKKPDGVMFPWPLVLAPLVMGLMMFLIFDRWYMLLIMLLSPMMFIGNMIQQSKQQGKRYRNELARFRERRRKIEADAFRALVEESAARRWDYMDPAQVLLTATGPRSRLWERRPTDPDWLHMRVGTSDQLSEISIKDPEREAHEENLVWTAPDVPVIVELTEYRVVGLAGPYEHRHAVGAWMLTQLAALHSPGEIEIRLIADRARDREWEWVRWLPHVRTDPGEDGVARVGTDELSTQRQLSGLMNLVAARHEELNDHGDFSGQRAVRFEPVVVFIEDAKRLRLTPGTVSLLQSGPAVDVYFVCMDDDVRLLPEECQAVIGSDGYFLTVEKTGKEPFDSVRPDLVDQPWCERTARALAPIKDVSLEDASGAIPAHSRLLDLLRLDPPQPEALLGGWRSTPRSTTATIGEGIDGPFTLDLTRDGPHGLVAGTTGSGKSELLQTIIASLAVRNRPDEFNFVLIDYKGGAAFKDCNNLPHTVGMVSDLDGHLTTRALASLGAELRRREHMLARADAKDIEDFTAQRDAGTNPTDERMPRLLIVIDEFAALVAELPDFVTGLVDIARRGRSLGVHLILATQRPNGVVSPEIKSNTNLRIALRVTDKTDSTDVIEAQDAAEIPKSLPGRAYARLGHSALIPFQSSRVGGRPRGEAQLDDIELVELEWDSLARAKPVVEEKDEDITTLTDLANLVNALNTAAESGGISSPPSPWLPPLDDIITVDELYEHVPRETVRTELKLPIGMVDLPHQQSRTAQVWDLENDTNATFVSMARMGRSSILRVIAGIIADNISVRDVHIFGVDCGNNALLPLTALPHVGAVVTRDQPDRLTRLTNRIRAEIARRQELLAEQGFADVAEQRKNTTGDDRLPYIVVLFDRWESFHATFQNQDAGALIDAWQQIIQESSSVGVRLVITNDRTGLVGRLSTMIDDKFVMRLTEISDYSSIGMKTKEVPGHMPPGRAFRSGALSEIQLALLDSDPDGTAQVRALQAIGRDAAQREADVPRRLRPFRVDNLPTRISFAEALALGDDERAGAGLAGAGAGGVLGGGVLVDGRRLEPYELPIAVGGDTLAIRPLSVVEDGPTFLVVGPRKSGRSNTLQLVTDYVFEQDYRVLLVVPRTSPLRALGSDPRVLATFTLETQKDEGKEKLAEFAELTKARQRTALIIDDMELLGLDGWLVEGIEEQAKLCRDSESFVMASGTPDELGSSYRGPAVALKKSRSGVILNPQGTNDGDIFGARLPRSIGAGGGNKGRGLLFRAGQWERIQVPLVEVPVVGHRQ